MTDRECEDCGISGLVSDTIYCDDCWKKQVEEDET